MYSKTEPPLQTVDRTCWVIYSSTKSGFFSGFELDEPDSINFTQNLQDCIVFDNIHIAENVINELKGWIPNCDTGILTMKCKL